GRSPDDGAGDHRPRAGLRGVPPAVPRVPRPGPDGRPLRHLLPGAALRPAPQDGRADRPRSRDRRPHPSGVPGDRPVGPRSRPRCRAAGMPDGVRYRPKWRLAVDQWVRLSESGVSFDWLTFDEGYGSKVPFLRFLNLVGQRFVAEVPVNFAVRDGAGGRPRRA